MLSIITKGRIGIPAIKKDLKGSARSRQISEQKNFQNNTGGTVGEDKFVQPIQEEQHVLLILVLLRIELSRVI